MEAGNRPTQVPTPVNDATHNFLNWMLEDREVDPTTITVDKDCTFVAEFEEIEIVNHKITLYTIKQNSGQANQQGLTTKVLEIAGGKSFNISEFGLSGDFRVFDSEGNIVSDTTITPTESTWYQAIDYNESLSTGGSAWSRTYQQVVYSGYGGKINRGSQKYADTQSVATTGNYTIPTTVPDNGFEFSKWYNLDTGREATPSRQSSNNHWVAIFVKSS